MQLAFIDQDRLFPSPVNMRAAKKRRGHTQDLRSEQRDEEVRSAGDDLVDRGDSKPATGRLLAGLHVVPRVGREMRATPWAERGGSRRPPS